MKSLRFTPPYQDDAIVAWLDGEMDPNDARVFAEQLYHDERLSARMEELKTSHQDYQRAFAPLLEEAPSAQMEERLETWLANTPASRPGVSRRALIAASVGFLLIGSGLGYLARPSVVLHTENERIRDLEAQYMSLYSAETLLDVDSSPPLIARGIVRTAEDIGLKVSEPQLALADAELKMIRMLRYESTAIAQIVWMHADFGPMALCISPLEQGDVTDISNEQRHGMNVAWWRDRDYQFVLIGRNPATQLKASARQLQLALL